MSRPAVGPVAARALGVRRDDLNLRFARARHLWPQLEGEALLDFLQGTLDPVLEAVDGRLPGRVDAVLCAAYDAALALAGQGLLRRDRRGDAMRRLWTDVFPAMAGPLAASPEPLIGKLCNATLQLAGDPQARVADWLQDMARLGPDCGDAGELEALGQVLAWRAGFAQFRDAALALLEALPTARVLQILDLPASQAGDQVVARIRRDPWWRADGGNGFREVARVGAFVGFGGLFPQPPRVQALDGQLFVASGDAAWLLLADAFGATLHRAHPDEVAALAEAPSRPIDDTAHIHFNRVVRGRDMVAINDVASLHSIAVTRHTVAVSSPDTHAVILLGGLGG